MAETMCFVMGMLKRVAHRTSLLGVRRGWCMDEGYICGGITAEGVNEDINKLQSVRRLRGCGRRPRCRVGWLLGDEGEHEFIQPLFRHTNENLSSRLVTIKIM
jgi:hypothetical protein